MSKRDFLEFHRLTDPLGMGELFKFVFISKKDFNFPYFKDHKMKINHCDKYIFSFLDKQNPLNYKSSKFFNCAFDKGDSDYIVRNNRKLVSKLFYNKEIIFVNQIHSSKIFIFDNIILMI